MTTAPDIADRYARWGTLLVWLLCAAALIWFDRAHIAQLQFSDPDDALRLAEVRDWLAGQSWFDVSQHRAWPPDGAPMHWSRLVDLPIVGALWLAGLVAPPALAERIALVAVPLLTLLCLFLTVHALARAVTGRRDMALAAVVMLSLSLGVLVQFHPLRIDHHGWQITLGTLAVLCIVRAPVGDARAAALAGLVMAVAFTIAVEVLPLAVGIGGVLALWSLLRKDAGRALEAYLAALSLGSALLMLVLLGWPAAAMSWCDASSPAYLLPIGAATLALLAVRRVIPQKRPAARLGALAVGGVAGAVSFMSYAPQCLGGPFAGLDPLVQDIWYRSIAEGMPLWAQPRDMQALLPLPSLLGVIGSLLAIRTSAPGRREAWIGLLCLQLLTFAVSIMVMRAMGLAHVLALPGNAWLFLVAFRAATSLPMSAARIILGVGSVALTPVGAEAIAAGIVHQPDAEATEVSTDRLVCTSHDGLRGLDALPPAIIFAPLDIGAHLLAYTRHSVIATGHHRSRPGMKAVISAFIAPPDRARAIVTATPAVYLAFCPDENEVRKYARQDDQSLMAALIARQAPSWLAPVPQPAGDRIRVYRIIRAGQDGTKRSATPFMQ